MIYDFLKDFHRRAEIVAIVDYITTRTSRKLKLRDYGFDSAESINLVMLVLCFIMEKSLVEETCTKDDVAGFIRRLDIEYFKKNIDDDRYFEIADFVIKDCLQNSGIPHYFKTYNFETDKEEKINVKLIDDRRVPLGNEGTYSYYMTPQGYKFMFNTLEIEDSLKVSIEQFKLSLSIKKRNFNAAKNNVDSLFNISKTQIQRINYFIKKVKEDISSTGTEEYEKIYNATFSSIDEQKEGYDNLYELIGKVENSILESDYTRIDKETLEKEIENISYIKGKLKFIISEQANLLLKQQELQKIYNEAVDNILYIGFENRLNFEETVTKKMEKNPQLAYPLIKLLRPLFKPDLNKMFNLSKVLKEQRIAGGEAETEGSNILMSNKYFVRGESEKDIMIRKANKMYLNIFETICQRALESSKKEILLSNLISDSKDEYSKFVPDIKVLTNVLIKLSSIKEVDFSKISAQSAKTVFNPSEAFDVKYCVVSLLDKDKSFNKISKLKILLSRNNKVFIPEKSIDESEHEGFEEEQDTVNSSFEKVAGLNCPDILFKIEVSEI
ncbi:hypothetical protein RBH29_01240 [Herbivorax sp. ANBcel31]|uniref:hypothetical protein n=1 Tax=Herbivorax sp. ANBcel31 TaxID=3069754 RepID=UPI0027AFED09|nr:hypothetical protein [Herbivorax sp. ANBcel31]MDQ2085062.1 hypothetical protein [Herbivorax sp. ANBcel31]